MAASDHLSLKRKRLEGVDDSDKRSQKKAKLKTDTGGRQDVNKIESTEKQAKNKKSSTEQPTADDISKIHNSKPQIVDGATKRRKLKPKLQLPRSSEEISSNWKQLLQSGKVMCSTKKSPTAQSQTAVKSRKKKTSNASEVDTSQDKSAKPSEIWFDDVDEILLEPQLASAKKDPLVKPYSYEGVTKVLGIDCEMVGVGEGGQESILARVSLVNQYGQCIYDKYVKPTERVTDYRTHVSGIRESDIARGKEFKTVQKEVGDLLLGRILVGHAIQNDLKVLFLTHPRKNIRDTSKFKPFRQLFRGGTPSLKKLTEKLLAVKVQQGEHNSVQDAQAAMRLYTMYRKQWEKSLAQKHSSARRHKKTSISDSVASDS